MESFGSTAIRISIDTGHAEYARGANGAPPVDYFVKSAGELLNYIHLQDADGYADRHWVTGEGTLRSVPHTHLTLPSTYYLYLSVLAAVFTMNLLVH